MTIALTVAAWALAVPASLPLAVLSVELMAGMVPFRRRGDGTAAPAIAVIMPAHNEAGGIVETLTRLSAVMPQGTRVVVVADNCSDDTAELARGAGAEVVERTDAVRRGKGYALACGRDYLAAGQPPAVAMVLDADCWFSPGSMERLAAAAMRYAAPAQAVYLFEPSHRVAAMVQVSNFAMMVKNLLRSRGMQRLGGPALLTGSGMAFPWALFARADLATGSIVEDLSLGIELTREGHAPRLVDTAHVYSAPATQDDSLQQRKRWEHGFLDILRRQAFPVLASGLKRGRRREIQLGLHLLVPPLAMLMPLVALVVALVAALSAAGGSTVPAVLVGGLFLVTLALILLCWMAHGRAFLSGRALWRLPLYVLWKVPVYAGFLIKPQSDWNRTPRQP